MRRTSTWQCSEGSWKDGKAPFLPHKSEWSNSFSSFHTWYLPQPDIIKVFSTPKKRDTAFLPGVPPSGHKLSSHALNAQELSPPALDLYSGGGSLVHFLKPFLTITLQSTLGCQEPFSVVESAVGLEKPQTRKDTAYCNPKLK